MRREEEGGFEGLSYEEALEAGKRAKHYGDVLGAKRWTAVYDDYGPANVESEPTKFSDGSYWATDADAKQLRDKREAEIRQLEHDEYTYKEDFKGLS